jgi:hypothetical protein
VRELALDIEEVSPEIPEVLGILGVGRLVILEGERTLGTLCVTPVGLTHASLQSSTQAWADLVALRQRMVVHTVTFVGPSWVQWQFYKRQGAVLTTDFIRWFAPVGSSQNPWQHLPPARAKKMRDHVHRAEKMFTLSWEPLSVENFSIFDEIYQREVAEKPNGTRVFYADIFARGQKTEDMWLLLARSKADGVVVGGAVVNPWGSFGDIGGEVKKYTTFLLSAFTAAGRAGSLGYFLDAEVMRFARDRGGAVYGHGADFPLWGSDLRCGLLTRKATCGMQPFPEGRVIALMVLEPEIISALPDGGCITASLREDAPFLQAYFADVDLGAGGVIQNYYKEPWLDSVVFSSVCSQYEFTGSEAALAGVSLPVQLSPVSSPRA